MAGSSRTSGVVVARPRSLGSSRPCTGRSPLPTSPEQATETARVVPPPTTRAGSPLVLVPTVPDVPRDQADRGDADAPAWTWALPPGAWCLTAAFRASPGLPAAVRPGGPTEIL